MESNKEQVLRQRELKFIGNVLAEYAHGTRNYMGIIRESAGWLGDLLAEADQGTELDREQFVDVLATIDKQIKILEQTTEHLSRLGQRIGTALCTFNPGEVIEEAVSFFTRFVRRHEASLTSEVAKALPSVYSNPVQVHVLVSVLLTDMLEHLGKDGKIILRAAAVDQDVLIEVEGHGSVSAPASPSEEDKPYWSTAQEIVADLGGRLQRAATGSDMKRTSIFLPTKQARNAVET